MAHSKPTRIANRGDAWRVTTVAGAFIIELCTADKRVLDIYWAWREMCEKRRQLDDYFRTRAQGRFSPAEIEDKLRAINRQSRLAEVQETQRFLHTSVPELKVTWLEWVTDALLDLFVKAEYASHHRDEKQEFKIPVSLAPGTPKGKQPGAARLRDLERNVRWFYRAKVQEKPESKHDLARDYASYVGRDNDCFSVVKNGIDQVEAILDLVAAEWSPLKSRAPLFEK